MEKERIARPSIELRQEVNDKLQAFAGNRYKTGGLKRLIEALAEAIASRLDWDGRSVRMLDEPINLCLEADGPGVAISTVKPQGLEAVPPPTGLRSSGELPADVTFVSRVQNPEEVRYLRILDYLFRKKSGHLAAIKANLDLLAFGIISLDQSKLTEQEVRDEIDQAIANASGGGGIAAPEKKTAVS